MKLIKTILFASAAILASGSTQAQLTDAVSGQTATAALVNDNFAYLEGLITELQTDVAALEAAAPTQNVTGRTYTLLNTRGFLEDQRSADTPVDIILFNAGASEVDITFGATIVTVGDIYEEQVDAGWDTVSNAPFATVTNIDSATDPGPQTVNYTQDGNVIDIPDFGLELYASGDGTMLAFRNYGQEISDDNGADRFVWEFGVFIEIPSAP